MTDLVERDDLLPDSASPRERAISAADAAIEDTNVGQIVTARDPLRTPLALLPRLAWERSVDVWDPQWPEDIKRAVVVAAPEVHRHKGTRYAVRTALAALNVDTTVTEWWEEVPRQAPYTFRVRAYARARLYDGPVLSAQLIRAVYTWVLRTKPLSRAFDLTLGAKFPATLGVGVVALIKTTRTVAVRPVLDAKGRTGLGLAGVALGKVASRQALHPRCDARGQSGLGLAAVAAGRTRVRFSLLLRSA